MIKFRFAHRVAVYRGGSAAMFYKSSAAAAHLIDAGLATVRKKASKAIIEIELTNAATGYVQGQVRIEQLGLRPGSFGIQIERFASSRCFAHRDHWPQLLLPFLLPQMIKGRPERRPGNH
jgi:hypothetical protein